VSQPGAEDSFQPSGLQHSQAGKQFVDQPSVPQPERFCFQPADEQLTQAGDQSLGQSSGLPPEQASNQSVAQPADQQPEQASYHSVVQESGQTVLKPMTSQGGQLFQIGSKLYSCQQLESQPSYQLAAQPGQTRYQPQSRPSSPYLTRHTESVKKPSYLGPVKPGEPTYKSMVPPINQFPPRPLQSTFQSVFRPPQLPDQPSNRALVHPSFLPPKPGSSSYDFVSQPSGQPLRHLHQHVSEPVFQASSMPGQ